MEDPKPTDPDKSTPSGAVPLAAPPNVPPKPEPVAPQPSPKGPPPELDDFARVRDPKNKQGSGGGTPPNLELVDVTRENVRGQIAKALILLLGIIVVSSFVSLWANIGIANGELKSLLSTILGPVAALVGSATGFYFGGKTDGSSSTAPTSPATPAATS